MLTPELLIEIIPLLNDKNAHLRTPLRTRIHTSTKHTRKTFFFFYLGSSTVISLKWVKTKWKSRNFSSRGRDRRGGRHIHRGGRRDRLGLEGWKEGGREGRRGESFDKESSLQNSEDCKGKSPHICCSNFIVLLFSFALRRRLCVCGHNLVWVSQRNNDPLSQK